MAGLACNGARANGKMQAGNLQPPLDTSVNNCKLIGVLAGHLIAI
jgi:hypothetical protein